MIGFKAKGIGSAEEFIQNLLGKLYVDGMSIEDGEKLALQCLKQAMEDKMNSKNVEIVVIMNSERKLIYRDRRHKENIIKNLPKELD